jgi:uncharacterized protein (TIGR00296 family)
MSLTDQQGREVVGLARRTLEQFTSGVEPQIPGAWPEEHLNQKRGVFVTLKNRDSSLRGCIGFPYPVKPLGAAVVEATVNAEAHDPRFPRVSEGELPGILVEASVLTVPRKLKVTRPTDLPQQVRVGVDGVIVSADGLSGLLLPQVASELRLSPLDFLSETCMKAGLLPDSWLRADTTVQVFQAEIFSEESPRGSVVRERLQED